MASLSITHEPSSQRRHFRITAPAQVSIGGTAYPTVNWSVGGFKIAGFSGTAEIGQVIGIEFALNFQGFHVSFPAKAEVVRHEGEVVTAKFIELGERETDLLSQFASSVLSGKVAAVDGVLKHLDRPVTKIALVQSAEVPAIARTRTARRVTVSVLYLCAGLALIGFAGWTLAQMWTTVQVETAVTSLPLEQIVSTDAGAIEELSARPGLEVRSGQLLLRVDSEVAARNVEKARQDARLAEIALAAAQQQVEQERMKLTAYQSIGDSQLAMESAKIKALAAVANESRAEFERIRKLWDYGLISRQVYEAQEATCAKHEEAVKQAEAEQKIVARSNQAISSGFFFSGNFLVGDLQARLGDEAAARERVKAAMQMLSDAQNHEAKREYRAPFDGVVMRVFKSAGMTVDRGEAMLVLRRAGEEAHIDAYLTQEEAGRIGKGLRAAAFIPAEGKHYEAEVAAVDRTAGFLKEIQTPKLQQPQFGWRTPRERTAYVRLNFVGVNASDLVQLPAGLPVRLSIPRKYDFSFATLTAVHAASPGENIFYTPRLWPPSSPLFGGQVRLPGNLRQRILDAADKGMRTPPAPVEIIHSSGVTDKSSAAFEASRRAFQDADNFLSLSLAYKLTGKRDYRESARNLVNAWADVNRPTGQPIDETRLEAFLWGLDLLGPEGSTPAVQNWLGRWSEANRNWSPGSKTEFNNHQTHHLKIQIMLDKYLGRESDYRRDLAAVLQHANVNLGRADGETIDYAERDAMHYQIFDLEPWIELALVTSCCESSVDRAFGFFEKQMRDNSGHTEFAHSTAPIDRRRAAAGFDYAKAQPYDVRKAARAIFAYATLPGRSVSPALRDAAAEGETHANLFYEARFYLWQAR